MHSSLYKRFTVSRGYEYSYYAVAPSGDNPTLLFAHGFPSTSTTWSRQAAYFKPKGYGLIIPDMLGYGGTAKPLEPEPYRYSLLANDLVELADAEGAEKVIAIGHDWGSRVVSSLANLHQERFIGFSFLAIGYSPPRNVTYEQMSAAMQQAAGYDTLGYWKLFASREGPGIIKDHIEAFADVLYAKDGSVWAHHWCPTGALQVFLESDSNTPRLESITDEEYREWTQMFLKNGFEAPVNYYRVLMTSPVDNAYKDFPSGFSVTKPVMFIGAANDAVGIAAAMERNTTSSCVNTTSKILEAGHWVMLEAAEAVNTEIEDWLSRLS